MEQQIQDEVLSSFSRLQRAVAELERACTAQEVSRASQIEMFQQTQVQANDQFVQTLDKVINRIQTVLVKKDVA